MIHKILMACAVMVAFAIPAYAAAKSPASQIFVNKAAMANQFEIDTSKMALQKSQDAKIKEFAQMMIDDHTQAGEGMKKALIDAKKTNDLTLPSTQMDKEHQDIISKLDNSDGAAFDKLYIDAQVSAHTEAVTLFGDYSKNGDNVALKDFATTTLPTLQKHKQHIDSIKAGNT